MTGLPWDHPHWAGRITPRETPESLERLRELAPNQEIKSKELAKRTLDVDDHQAETLSALGLV